MSASVLRSLLLLLVVCVLVGLVETPARAATDAGEITVTVVDAVTGSPIADARTILLGPQTASSLTTRAGIIKYTDVPSGIYRVRVVHSGYVTGASSDFDVLPNRAVSVRVTLALASPSGLKTIGSIVARSNVTIASNDLAENSPVRRLSDSLTDALDKVAGVSVTQDATDPSGAITVSLNGHDESQTAITLDGIQLSGPGATANLRAIGTDLFAGSSSSTSPGAGALGGGISFRTLQPTQSLQVRATGTTGTFDRSNEQLAATGSVGRVGVALQHTWRGANSPLTFQNYLDQSGLTYAHEGESHSLGDFAKFRYRLGDERTTIVGTALSNNTGSLAICARNVTLLPCGIGPGNGNYGRYGSAYLSVQSLVGTVATTLTAFESAGTQNTDDVNRYLLLPTASDGTSACGGRTFGPGTSLTYQQQLCPSVSTSDNLTRGFTGNASIAQGRHTFVLSATTSTGLNTVHPTLGSRFESSFTTAITSSTYTLSDSFKSNDRLSLAPRLSVANTTTLGTSLLGGLGASWRPTPADTFGASINVGSSQPSVNLNRSFSDPVSARFDCSAGTAIVNGPGDTNGGRQSAVSLDASWAHAFRSGSSISLAAFSQVQSGQIVNALIAEPASFFSNGYLATLQAAFNAQSVCGAAAPPPVTYVNESIGGTRRVYQGFNANVRIGLGRYLVALPTYSLNIAKLTAASGRLFDGPSTTLVGAQLPNRPIHRAGLTLDVILPRSGLEVLGNAQYTGANNQQNLGPYVVVSAGLSHAFGPGRVTLFENNVFGTYGGSFATDAYAQPLALSANAGVLRTAATPLTPRTLNMTYALTFGGPRPSASFPEAPRTARVAGAPGALGALGATPAASDARRFVPAPPPPGVDPLGLATSRPACDAQTQAAAAPLLAAIRAYVTAYEAKTTLPGVPDLQTIAHVVTVDPMVPYYIELLPRVAQTDTTPDAAIPGRRPASPFRRFVGCAYLTVYTNAEAKAKGILTQGGRPGLFYVPHVGLVFVRAPELPQGGGSLRGGT